MRLSTRLNLFFLSALAMVLAGFSATLYLLAAADLSQRADERLEAALNTLAAAAEVNAKGVEWEPEERQLAFGRRTVEGPFAWRVADDRGNRLDGASTEVGDPPFEASKSIRDQGSIPRPTRRVDGRGQAWRVARIRLEAARPSPGEAPVERPPGMHDAIEIDAGVSLEVAEATLRRLAWTLGGLSTGVWLVALAGGSWLCGRALRPVAAMASAARAIGGDESGRRLPVPSTADELEGLGRAFNGLLDRLQESSERQRRFTGDASHQLRTPLTVIQGQVDLALRHDRPPESYRQTLAVVQRRTRDLRQIVEALLFLARADVEASRPGLEPIDLEGWLVEHLQRRSDDPRSSDVRLEIPDDPGGPIRARVQPALLGVLVDNLLDNAGKYGPAGTPIVVRLDRDRDGASARIAVEDRGPGIAEADVPHLFEPFFRSPEARDRGISGVGLGLSVARRLAGSLGGTIDFEGAPGRGSRFVVRLPVDPGSESSS